MEFLAIGRLHREGLMTGVGGDDLRGDARAKCGQRAESAVAIGYGPLL